MKRRTYPEKKSGQSPYGRHGKREFDYSAMYNRNPELAALRKKAQAERSAR